MTALTTTKRACKLSSRARHRRGTANPHRVSQLPREEYNNVNWLQCLQAFFERQTPTNQRAIRATITSHKEGELTRFGFTVEQLASALTAVSHPIPQTVLDANRDEDFGRLAF